MPSGWALATSPTASHSHSSHLGQQLGAGVRGNDRRGRKGSQCFFWSGTIRSSPGQNKQAKGRSCKSDRQHMALAWNRDFSSALPTPCIPQERRFYTLLLSLSFFKRDVWGKESLNCIEDIFLMGLKQIQKGIPRLMKREEGSCRDQNHRDFGLGKKQSQKEKEQK